MYHMKVQMDSEKATWNYIWGFFFCFSYSNVEDNYILFCDFKFYRKKSEMHLKLQSNFSLIYVHLL